MIPNLSHGKASLNIAVIYTALWLAEDGFLLGTIVMIVTPVSSAQPGRVDLVELVDLNHPGQDAHHLAAAITVNRRARLQWLRWWHTHVQGQLQKPDQTFGIRMEDAKSLTRRKRRGSTCLSSSQRNSPPGRVRTWRFPLLS